MDRGKRAFDLRVEGTMFQVSVGRHGHGASGIDRETARWGSRRSDPLLDIGMALPYNEYRP